MGIYSTAKIVLVGIIAVLSDDDSIRIHHLLEILMVSVVEALSQILCTWQHYKL